MHLSPGLVPGVEAPGVCSEQGFLQTGRQEVRGPLCPPGQRPFLGDYFTPKGTWPKRSPLCPGGTGGKVRPHVFRYSKHIQINGIESGRDEPPNLGEIDFQQQSQGHSVGKESVQFSSVAQSRLTLCDPLDCNTPGLPVHHQLPEFIQTHVHGVGDAIQPSHPLSPPSPPAFNLSQHQGLFQWVSSSHQVAKDWSFSFSISPSNEYPGLISFRMGWLGLLAVQGTLKSLLQHCSSKLSILRCSAFFIVQLSHPYMTTVKTIALTRRTFVGKVTSLLFNMLSRLVITFLPRSKHLLI